MLSSDQVLALYEQRLGSTFKIELLHAPDRGYGVFFIRVLETEWCVYGSTLYDEILITILTVDMVNDQIDDMLLNMQQHIEERNNENYRPGSV